MFDSSTELSLRFLFDFPATFNGSSSRSTRIANLQICVTYNASARLCCILLSHLCIDSMCKGRRYRGKIRNRSSNVQTSTIHTETRRTWMLCLTCRAGLHAADAHTRHSNIARAQDQSTFCFETRSSLNQSSHGTSTLDGACPWE